MNNFAHLTSGCTGLVMSFPKPIAAESDGDIRSDSIACEGADVTLLSKGYSRSISRKLAVYFMGPEVSPVFKAACVDTYF